MEHELPKGEYVAILDAGSQYGKVIDRKVRELKVETVILPLDTPTSVLQQDPNLKGVIISGGPNSVHDADAPPYQSDLFTLNKPILGICYGMQLLTVCFGGKVSKGAIREDGQDQITVQYTSSKLFDGMDKTQTVLLTHGDSITSIGEELQLVAASSAGIPAALQHKTKPFFGVQFHPEVELTVNGVQILKNFLCVSQCSFNFTMEDREAVALRLIRDRTAAGQKVLCLASGGVDSTVCAVLLLKALGPERVVCVHINHGFMRLNESEAVLKALQTAGVHVHVVNATSTFADATTMMPARGGRASYKTGKLSETVDPEEKRTIIGDTFMSVCDSIIKDMNLDIDNLLLAQGTLRPDLIESGSSYASKQADAIKTHHNDTAVVRQLRNAGRIIEPLCDYHKDEVRELGTRLGIPRPLVERQPFPGPGLAIRTLCSDGTRFQDEQFASTENIVRTVCTGDDQNAALSATLQSSLRSLQLSSCVLPVRTVGVQGDGRTYAYAAALSLGRQPTAEEWSTLMDTARAIPKMAHSVNRVVFMFGSKENASPTTVTKTVLCKDVLDKLRTADDVVHRILVKYDLVRKLSQVPVVLVPVGFGSTEKYSIVIRTFITNDFMTGIPATPGSDFMPLNALHDMVGELSSLPFVAKVLYDCTAKPPGTTEWE